MNMGAMKDLFMKVYDQQPLTEAEQQYLNAHPIPCTLCGEALNPLTSTTTASGMILCQDCSINPMQCLTAILHNKNAQ